ncbi:LysE family translocator [Enterobacter hormaechei]|uniref:LysE family translocator n=1 Tax=Enterobacter hormaechei TaxID=158836 RepID=UPI003B22483C
MWRYSYCPVFQGATSVGQSVVNGRRAGIISAAGVALGSCTHAIASAVGLTALITASPMMFTIIKSLGAAYLVYLGSKMIWGTLTKQTTNHNEAERVKAKATLTSLLTKGFITTLTNPKVLLFFISFFPQFVAPGSEHQTASFLLLGMTYALIAFMTDLTFAVLAGSAAGTVSQNRRLQKILDRIVGVTFIGLGLRLAFTRR